MLIPLLALSAAAALAQAPATGQFLLRMEPTRPGFTLQNMSAEETQLANQHFQYLKSLHDSGKLNLAAQVFDPKGLWGIIIVNAPNLEAARALLEGDPSVKANLFRGEAVPVRVVFENSAGAPKAGPPISPAPKGE